MLLKFRDSGKLGRKRSITELKDSAIYMKPSKSNNLKSISFHCNLIKVTLKMPRFLVNESTAFTFMNMVALEMCTDFQNNFEVTSYF